jgi:carbon starvation protein CstA
MIALWTASMYLYRNGRQYWLTAVPATFMSAVSVTYFFIAPECLHLSAVIAYPVGIVAAIVFLGIFIYNTRKPAVTGKKEDNGHHQKLHTA